VGLDYHLLNKRLKFSVEAFDFNDVHLRAFAQFNIFKGVYLIGGGDHLASRENASAFFGGGFLINNDDLKVLASKMAF
jgi:hypothetical protein